MPARVSPVERIPAEIDQLFADPSRDVGDVVEDVARLGARLVLPSALEAEVTVFPGRETTPGSRADVSTRKRSSRWRIQGLVIAWHLFTRNPPYTDLGADYFLDRHNGEAYKNRLVRQLQRMGHKVTLEPAQVA